MQQYKVLIFDKCFIADVGLHASSCERVRVRVRKLSNAVDKAAAKHVCSNHKKAYFDKTTTSIGVH